MKYKNKIDWVKVRSKYLNSDGSWKHSYEQLDKVAEMLKCSVSDVPQKIAKLKSDTKELKLINKHPKKYPKLEEKWTKFLIKSDKDKYKYLNKNKTFIWHIGKKHGMFKIDNHYNIISGKYKGKHYKDILKECDKMLMTYEFHKGMASLEIIK